MRAPSVVALQAFALILAFAKPRSTWHRHDHSQLLQRRVTNESLRSVDQGRRGAQEVQGSRAGARSSLRACAFGSKDRVSPRALGVLDGSNVEVHRPRRCTGE